MTCTKQEICVHEEYCQRHIGQNFDGCILFCRHLFSRDGKPMTNEEWLRSATFEEMAGTLYEWYSQGHIEGKVGKQLSSVTRVVEWLKEKHQ